MQAKKSFIKMTGMVLFLSGVIYPLFASSLQWRRVESGTLNNVQGVSAPDTIHIWAVAGKILRSTDGGRTWDSLSVPGNEDIEFVDTLHGWTLGGGGTSLGIIKTSDGGNTWRVVEKDRFFWNAYTISFSDTLHGWIGGGENPLLFTKNGGESWDTMSIKFSGNPRFSVHKVFFTDSLNGWAGGLDFPVADTAILVQTTDGGKTWQPRNLPGRFGQPIGRVDDIDFLDSLNGYLMATTGAAQYFLNTTNSGVTWDTSEILLVNDYWNGSDYIDSAIGWAAGATVVQGASVSLVSASGDGWMSLKSDSITEGYPLFDIDMFDSTHGWAVGGIGTILVYGDVTTSVPDPKGQLPAQFELGQNYPNPFNQGTQIPFSFSGNQAFQVTLSIYNLLGQPVRKLLDRKLLPGSHSVFWDGEDDKGRVLPSGIYFYKLTIGEQHSVKKMLLIK